MAGSKKKTKRAAPPQFGQRLFHATRLVLLRPRVLVAFGVIAMMGWGMNRLWQQVAPQVIHRQHYLLRAERIAITPPPEWLTTDVLAEVIRNSGLDQNLSVLDDAFLDVVKDAFALHPWVESVDRITKRFPAGVDVELTYRRPIAVVEMVGSGGVELVPIDRHGVHLPSGDVPDIRKQYLPRIGGIVERPPIGQPWSDQRVLGAAELAQQLADIWESMHLVDILPSARPEVLEDHRYFVYDLITRGGTRIVWGAAPNAAPPEEPAFDAKLQRLRTYVNQYGPLDSARAPAEVNVRRKLEITPRTVKKEDPETEDASLMK